MTKAVHFRVGRLFLADKSERVHGFTFINQTTTGAGSA